MKNVARMLVLLGFLAFSGAQAITPKNGFWVNWNDGGMGYNIEINGDVMVVAVYTYDSNGKPLWYLSSSPLKRDGTLFEGALDKYRNGQCIDCAYSREELYGNDGILRIKFTSDTTAEVTLPGGGKKEIEWFFRGVDNSPADGKLPLTWKGIDMQKLTREEVPHACKVSLTFKNTTSTAKLIGLVFDVVDEAGVVVTQALYSIHQLGAGQTATVPQLVVAGDKASRCSGFGLRFNAAASVLL